MKHLILISLFFCSSGFAQTSLRALQWGIHNTGSPQYLSIDHYTSGAIAGIKGEDIQLPALAPALRKVVVAILDTGIDYKHPQLKDALFSKGFNILNNSTDATDQHGHGTHIAGIIAARPGSKDFQGVSQNAVILPIKVIQNGPNAPVRPQDVDAGPGTALTENVAKGVTYAIQNGAEIINLSLAWPASIRSKKMDAAMDLAVQKNVLIVSSAGNDSTIANVYPCIYSNVICVGAHGPDGAFTHFSNFGPMVDILAPGISILSAWPLSRAPVAFAGSVGYEYKDGTSMSAPFVAGALAELLARGIPPLEAKNRILLGSRPTKSNSLFFNSTPEAFSKELFPAIKSSTFGNLDVNSALQVAPRPYIHPIRKAPYDIEWNGTDPNVLLPISWINHWTAAQKIKIQIENQTYLFDALDSLGTVDTPFTLNIKNNNESSFELHATVSADGYPDLSFVIRGDVSRTLTANTLPTNARVLPIAGINPSDYDGIRTAVTSETALGQSNLVFTRINQNKLELVLVRDGQFINLVTFDQLTADQLLNIYRLPDQSFAIIFAKQDPGAARPNYIIKYLNPHFEFKSEGILGTDITTLNENLRWTKVNDRYVPLWIALGFTPPKELDPYDPWNPTAKDQKIPRLFYLSNGELHRVPLSKNQTPLQIFLDGRVLVSEGTTYFQKYKVATIENGVIIKSDPFSFPVYRMLIGLDQGKPNLDLRGIDSSTQYISGASSPGNLRASSLDIPRFDGTLIRSSPLDALMSIIGGFQDATRQFFFVQTHYNLQFIELGKKETSSVSMNRYSYIPSMIFNRSFFPTVVTAENSSGKPAIYIPASVSNYNTSEIIYADPDSMTIYRPVQYRLRLKDKGCNPIGNLTPERVGNPALQIFACGNSLIQIPLEIVQ